jgi:hypothetical protein
VCITLVLIVDTSATQGPTNVYNEFVNTYTPSYTPIVTRTCFSIDPKGPPGVYKDPALAIFTPRNPFGHRRAIHDTIDLTPHGNTKWTANCPTTHYNAGRFESESSFDKNYCHPIYLKPTSGIYQVFKKRTA